MKLIMPEGGEKSLIGDDLAIFERAFEIIQVELGLAENPSIVRVCYNKMRRNGDAILRGSLDRKSGTGPSDPFKINISDAGPMIGSDIITMCHEMIHVQQVVRGELVDTDDGDENSSIWKGEMWTEDRARIASFFSGKNQWLPPWELDAHERMEPLFEKVITRLPLNDIKFMKKQVLIATKGKHGRRDHILEALAGLSGLTGLGKIVKEGAVIINKETGEQHELDSDEIPDGLREAIIEAIGGTLKKGTSH